MDSKKFTIMCGVGLVSAIVVLVMGSTVQCITKTLFAKEY